MLVAGLYENYLNIGPWIFDSPVVSLLVSAFYYDLHFEFPSGVIERSPMGEIDFVSRLVFLKLINYLKINWFINHIIISSLVEVINEVSQLKMQFGLLLKWKEIYIEESNDNCKSIKFIIISLNYRLKFYYSQFIINA